MLARPGALRPLHDGTSPEPRAHSGRVWGCLCHGVSPRPRHRPILKASAFSLRGHRSSVDQRGPRTQVVWTSRGAVGRPRPRSPRRCSTCPSRRDPAVALLWAARPRVAGRVCRPAQSRRLRSPSPQVPVLSVPRAGRDLAVQLARVCGRLSWTRGVWSACLPPGQQGWCPSPTGDPWGRSGDVPSVPESDHLSGAGLVGTGL